MRGGRGGRGDRAAAQADLAPAWRRRRCGPRAGRNGGHPFRDGPLSRDRPLSPLRGLMRRLSFVLLLVLFAVLPLAAQTAPQPNLVLTLFGGAVGGHALWSVGRQPPCVLATAPGGFTCTAQYDTLELNRDIGASIAVGISGTYFKNPHLGFQGEVYFLGLPFDDRCINVAPYNADADRKNEQLCDDISGASLSTSAIALFGGLIVRASATHWLSPYLRAGVGLVAYSGGTVSLSGRFQLGSTVYSRAVILD